MKKVLLIALALVLALGCVASFAATEESFAVDRINDFEDEAFEYTDFATNEEQAGNYTAFYVDGVKGADGKCLKVTNSYAFFPNPDIGNFYNNYSVSCDILPRTYSSFVGLLADYRKNGDTEDINCDPFPLTEVGVSDENADIAFDSGWGFTFLKTNKNAIRVFTNYDDEYSYIDIDLGLGDLSEAWHTYSMYRLCNNSAATQTAWICVDYVPVARIEGNAIYDLVNDASVECVAIEDIGTASFVVIGDDNADTAVYFDNLWARDDNNQCSSEPKNWSENVAIADAFATLTADCAVKAQALADKKAAIAEAEAANPDKTETPTATKAPVVTAEPAADATEAPAATEIPAAATEAPAEENSGCGSVIGCSVILAMGVAVVALRKKETF